MASPQQGDLKVQALRQARAMVAALEFATEGSLQISGRIRHPLCHHQCVTKFLLTCGRNEKDLARVDAEQLKRTQKLGYDESVVEGMLIRASLCHIIMVLSTHIARVRIEAFFF
ncbi:hypothetical protein PoB_001412600 [Plakobranchus ocellatus]|uniref:Uncharacterized protein n=1 Tax=Plakobranchus ocellatus TaxID=259542 RepID=A0AAV3YK40_9GAST|nr:hypothetical protein PoB_001412600 [Plakobranchus ocellatus]